MFASIDECLIVLQYKIAAQWFARLTRNVEVLGLSSIKGSRCFLEQETLFLLLSTGWFQERIRTKINWGLYGGLT